MARDGKIIVFTPIFLAGLLNILKTVKALVEYSDVIFALELSKD
jgi:hypothetical protein